MLGSEVLERLQYVRESDEGQKENKKSVQDDWDLGNQLAPD